MWYCAHFFLGEVSGDGGPTARSKTISRAVSPHLILPLGGHLEKRQSRQIIAARHRSLRLVWGWPLLIDMGLSTNYIVEDDIILLEKIAQRPRQGEHPGVEIGSTQARLPIACAASSCPYATWTYSRFATGDRLWMMNNGDGMSFRTKLIPAAQYVRMSDEQQQYSIANQETAIQEFASKHGFQIVKTYADPGKSGVEAKKRTALQELLKDVVSGEAKYRAILVYDVSRWGRFQNNDEAAHYEFLCQSSGIPLHYCAEPFSNDGTATSSLLKALKRSMAAEFSRELSEKVIQGKTRLVSMGYWVGGQPGYGYRRMMVSAAGEPKQLMKHGEQKHMRTDRVILVPGSEAEIECVRLIFSLAVLGNGCMSIAKELNRRGFLRNGKPWAASPVHKIVTNPKYAGCNVWNRTSERLQAKRHRNEALQWITKEAAFPSIVDQEVFDEAQSLRKKKSDYWWSETEMLSRVRALLKKKGYLTETLLRTTPGMPSTTTLHAHFGTYRELYELVGYHIQTIDAFKGEQSKRSIRLRRRLVTKLQRSFPDHISVTRISAKHTRSVLVIDKVFKVSMLFARKKLKDGSLMWIVEPNSDERDFITLVCKMNAAHDRVIGYYLLPHMHPLKKETQFDGYLRRARPLARLSFFYEAVCRIWAERQPVRQVRANFP